MSLFSVETNKMLGYLQQHHQGSNMRHCDACSRLYTVSTIVRKEFTPGSHYVNYYSIKITSLFTILRKPCSVWNVSWAFTEWNTMVRKVIKRIQTEGGNAEYLRNSPVH